MSPSRACRTTLVVAAAFAAAACVRHRVASTLGRPPTADEMAQFWVEPKDLEQRDLFYGAGGAQLAPDASTAFRFVKPKKRGTAGYTVEDPLGRSWSVKLGSEAGAEVAGSRLLWAIGYRQPPVYALERWTVEGGPAPGLAKGPGRFRAEGRGWKESGPWSWYENPFVGTQPYRGLIVLMRIINNWDIQNRNNLVYDLAQPFEGVKRLYVVKDLGASFGRTLKLPRLPIGTKNVVEDFERQEFIDQVRDGTVDFENKGRRHRQLFEGISTADVRWTCALLARLSAKQWRDAFRAAACDQPTADRFIRKLHEKIAEGLALP